MGVTISALRWELSDHDLGRTEGRPQAASERIRRDGAAVLAEDDAASRAVVLGVLLSLLGFWLPLAATLMWRRGSRSPARKRPRGGASGCSLPR
jgi:hypothetical protein